MVDTQILINSTTNMPYVAVIKNIPIWLNIWFAISIILTISLIVFGLWHWFKIYCRNRTNVIIHMPDKKRQLHSYKNFVGSVFKIKSSEQTKDNIPHYFHYEFEEDAIEYGYFGRYIEFDYGNIKALSSKNRKNLNFGLLKFVSALLETDLAVDLLISSNFKTTVIILLWCILGGTFIVLCLTGYNTYIVSATKGTIQQCSLSWDNQTQQVIKTAIHSLN